MIQEGLSEFAVLFVKWVLLPGVTFVAVFDDNVTMPLCNSLLAQLCYSAQEPSQLYILFVLIIIIVFSNKEIVYSKNH
jgi:hypothetical protein